MSINNKKQLDRQLTVLNTLLITFGMPVVILFYYKPKNFLLTILILNLLLILNHLFNTYIMNKEIKSQLNILKFIIILCSIISSAFLFKINNKYFKQVSLLLMFNMMIYALINAYTKSQKTLLNLTAFYTIYVFFTTVGIFMLTQGNNVLQENQPVPPPHDHHSSNRPRDDDNPPHGHHSSNRPRDDDNPRPGMIKI